ncbi:hypothetical protein SK128_015641 [Halocaridina rubra]|uniref:Uncharacterized protein n=1 Tax=Halocaridina rubra TaxID=373956 RepID=A0AAN9A8N0_HALRR
MRSMFSDCTQCTNLDVKFIHIALNKVMYSGNLTALLTIKSYEKGIDTLNDLQKAMPSGLTLSLPQDTLVEYFFSTAKSGIFKDIWELVLKQDPKKSFRKASIKHTLEVIPKVLHEKYVIILPLGTIEIYIRGFGSRNFHKSADQFYPISIGIACPIGSPLKEAFNKKLHGIMAGGLVSKWIVDENLRYPDKVVQIQNEGHSPITLVQLQVIMIFMCRNLSLLE